MRVNGYRILDEEAKKIPREKEAGAHYGFWLEIDGEEYYFKVETEFEQYMELFCEELAKVLKISTISYDLAYYDGLKGVISKDMNPNGEGKIKIGTILKKYYNDVICENPALFSNEIFLENAYNLETVWWSLQYYYRDRPNKDIIVENLMNHIMESFYFQLLTFNYDMNYQNIIILGDENPRIAPNFDYGGGGLINFDIPIYNYGFPATPHSMSKRSGRQAKEVIQNFLEISDVTFVNKLESYVDVLLNLDLETIIKKIEERTESPVPKEVQDYLIGNMKEQIKTIKEMITKTKNRNR